MAKVIGFVVLLCVAAFSAGLAAADDARYFCIAPPVDTDGDYVTLPAGAKYVYAVDGTIVRNHSTSYDGHGHGGVDRPMVITVASDYLLGDFAAALTYRQDHPGGDIAYFGFGQAQRDSAYFDEPIYSAHFRIHENPVWDGIHAAVKDASGGIFQQITQIGSYVSNTDLNLLIVREGDALSLCLPDAPGAPCQTYSVANDLPFLNTSNARLFFSNTTTGAVFKNFCVQPLSEPDSDGDGVSDADDSCPATASGAAVDTRGCSGAQNVASSCPATAAWKNHGQYVSCVSKTAEAQVANGLLTDAEKDAIVSAAAQSSVAKKK